MVGYFYIMRLNSHIKGVKVKPIPNYPEYLASFDGRVYSTKLQLTLIRYSDIYRYI